MLLINMWAIAVGEEDSSCVSLRCFCRGPISAMLLPWPLLLLSRCNLSLDVVHAAALRTQENAEYT